MRSGSTKIAYMRLLLLLTRFWLCPLLCVGKSTYCIMLNGSGRTYKITSVPNSCDLVSLSKWILPGLYADMKLYIEKIMLQVSVVIHHDNFEHIREAKIHHDVDNCNL